MPALRPVLWKAQREAYAFDKSPGQSKENIFFLSGPPYYISSFPKSEDSRK